MFFVLGITVIVVGIVMVVVVRQKYKESTEYKNNNMGAKNVVKVLDYGITKDDITDKKSLAACYGDTLINDITAVIQLIDSLLERAVLNEYFAVSFSNDDVNKQVNWVNKNTKAPHILECVLDSVRDGFFRNFYIRPIMENSAVHLHFAHDKDIHAAERQRVRNIQKELEVGKQLRDFPEFRAYSMEASPETSLELQEMGAVFSSDPLVSEVLSKMSPGDTYPEVVESDNSIQIIHLVDKNKETYEVEAISVAKKDFSPWFHPYVKENIPIVLYDHALARQLQEEYPDLWWIDNVIIDDDFSTPTSHSEQECVGAGGSVYFTGNGTICKIDSSSCPSGWVQAGNWQRYSSVGWDDADGDEFEDDTCWADEGNATSFSNTPAYDYEQGSTLLGQDSVDSCAQGTWSDLWLVCHPDYGCGTYQFYNVVTNTNPTTNRVEIGCY